MFCNNIARLAVAKERIHVWQPLATAKQATFLQNILWESYGKFNFKKFFFKKFIKYWYLKEKYIEMRFHGNQLSWVIKHPFNRLCFKYHSPGFICFSTILAPVISILDKIYCTWLSRWKRHCCSAMIRI